MHANPNANRIQPHPLYIPFLALSSAQNNLKTTSNNTKQNKTTPQKHILRPVRIITSKCRHPAYRIVCLSPHPDHSPAPASHSQPIPEAPKTCTSLYTVGKVLYLHPAVQCIQHLASSTSVLFRTKRDRLNKYPSPVNRNSYPIPTHPIPSRPLSRRRMVQYSTVLSYRTSYPVFRTPSTTHRATEARSTKIRRRAGGMGCACTVCTVSNDDKDGDEEGEGWRDGFTVNIGTIP
jgi:hypothetical protein